MNWKPGDVALYLADAPALDLAGASGQIVTLISYHGFALDRKSSGHITNAWFVRDERGTCYVAEQCLRRPYDGNEKTSWEDCVWNPDAILVPILENINENR